VSIVRQRRRRRKTRKHTRYWWGQCW